MNANDILIRQAERHAHLRRILLTLQAIAYTGWIGSKGLEAIGMDIDADALHVVQGICLPIWGLSLFGTLWLMRLSLKNRGLRVLLDDERTAGLAGKAFQVSYWVLLVAIAAIYAASFVTAIDIHVVMPILLSLVVATPSLTYAFLYRN